MFSKIFNVDTILIGPVGKDFNSTGYSSYLENAKIDTRGLFKSEVFTTPSSFVFNGKKASRIFFHGEILDKEGIAFKKHAISVMEQTKYEILYCTTGVQEINESALFKSKAYLNSYSPGHEIGYNSVKSLSYCLNYTDILFLNQNESFILQRKFHKSIPEILCDFKVKIGIVTLGRNGSRLYLSGKNVKIPAIRAQREISTAGAGDAYAGAFVANYLKRNDAEYSAKIASATASFVVEELGCQNNIPDMKKILQRLKV